MFIFSYFETIWWHKTGQAQQMLNTGMITIVIAGYVALVLTIVLALFAGAARRPEPKPQGIVATAALPVERAKKPARKNAASPSKVHGGTEVLAFGA